MSKQIKAMIISVGGSPEPIIFTINSHRPDFICFLASEQSVDKIGEIKSKVDYSFKDCKVMVNDPQNLLECYRKSLECFERMRQAGYEKENMLIDYTCGTKPLSGALLSVGLAEGCSFSYIGGDERDKNSLGVVKTGTEKVIRGINPWDLYAVDQRKKICLFFNCYQFKACQEIINDALEHCRFGSREEELFKGLRHVVDGYIEWERFEHKKAREFIDSGYKVLKTFYLLTENAKVGVIISQVEKNLDYLNSFARETRGYQDLSRWHVLDLLGNAIRRYEEGRFDDSVARVYRALEMYAQWILQSSHKINTSKVLPEQVPVEIRKTYIQKYGRGDIMQLPLTASFNLLSALGDPAGETFIRNQDEIEKLLSARNFSVLAHGVQPAGPGPCKNFTARVMDVCSISGEEIPVFPKLDI